MHSLWSWSLRSFGPSAPARSNMNLLSFGRTSASGLSVGVPLVRIGSLGLPRAVRSADRLSLHSTNPARVAPSQFLRTLPFALPADMTRGSGKWRRRLAQHNCVGHGRV